MARTWRSERAMLAGRTLARKDGSGRALMLSTAILSGNGVSRANGVASRLNTNRATRCQPYGRISRQSRQVFELTRSSLVHLARALPSKPVSHAELGCSRCRRRIAAAKEGGAQHSNGVGDVRAVGRIEYVHNQVETVT